MAKNTNAGVDVQKVTEDAEKIARGDAPTPETKSEGTADAPTASTPTPPAQDPTTSNTAGNTNTGDQLADKLKANNQEPITQGAPGALKPGLKDKPVERISEDDAEQKQHEDLVAQYGPDYITASKPGFENRQFSRRAWDLLGPASADGTKDGWKAAVKVPAEVKALKGKKPEGAENE
jgi:hypothetical protein